MLKIRKRSGEEVLFDRSKIERAIEKANASVSIPERLNRDIIAGIALSIENACSNMKTIPTYRTWWNMPSRRPALTVWQRITPYIAISTS